MSEKLLNVEIITPQQTLFSGKAQAVSVPGSLSPFEILYNHAAIVSSLDAGVIRIVGENKAQNYFAIDKGFVEVRSNVVSILVDDAKNAAEVDENKTLAEIRSLLEKLDGLTVQSEIDTAKKKIYFNEIKLKAALKIKSN